MDVKSTFLNGILNEEVYVEQSKGFQDPRTLMPTNLKLSKDESGKKVEETLYRSMIGSLLYLTASKLDIAFSIGVCAKYQACPKESHLIALKRIIRKNTSGGCFYIGNCLVARMNQGTMVVLCDNTSAINISKNPILHSRTKHIDIRHHFICDLVEDKVVSLEYVPTEGQIAYIFTKPLDVSKFESLRKSIGLCTIS
ncbi:Copia protein [Vitis vinifera]|uniref:Copia protein n=1 Tax=Vitis vinifera TaxID=29760 RepID=A0A438HAZ8_VITVI|nr:Copia protein [Vitis vinifera]